MKMPKKLVVVGLERKSGGTEGFPSFKVIVDRGVKKARAVYTLSRETNTRGNMEKKWTLRAHDNSIDETRKYKSVMQFLVENKVTDEAFTGEVC